MRNGDVIPLTTSQQIAASKVVRDNFGCDFQTGRYAGHDDWVYVAWQGGPNTGTHFAFIAPDGKVVSEIA